MSDFSWKEMDDIVHSIKKIRQMLIMSSHVLNKEDKKLEKIESQLNELIDRHNGE